MEVNADNFVSFEKTYVWEFRDEITHLRAAAGFESTSNLKPYFSDELLTVEVSAERMQRINIITYFELKIKKENTYIIGWKK